MNKIIGAIGGDIVGSKYEFKPIKTAQFDFQDEDCHYTDDTVMTVANMLWLLGEDHSNDKLIDCMHKVGNMYPRVGYGGTFKKWLCFKRRLPYNSWGNGSAMRVSPIGWAFDTLEETLEYAKKSAEVTHNHPEGIKGAQATAACVFLARNGKSKDEIKEYIEKTFDYDLSRTCNEIRPTYKFHVSCQQSVPEAIICFLEGGNYEEVIRLCVSLGGDCDTMGAIAGAIAEAYYREYHNEDFEKFVWNNLPEHMKLIIKQFSKKFLKNE